MSNPLSRSSGDPQRFDAAVWPYRRILWHAAGLAIAAMVPLLVYAFIAGSTEQELLAENGLMEHAQVIFLALAATLAAATLVRSGSRLGPDRVFWQYVAFAILCVSILGITREIQGVDIRTRLDELSMSRSQKRIVRVLVLLAFPVVSALSMYRLKGHFDSLWRFFRVSFLWPIVPFAACLIASQLSEDLSWVFAEETFELVAYSMLVATCGWLLTTKKLAQPDYLSHQPVSVEDAVKADPVCLSGIGHHSPWDAPNSIRLVRVLGNGRAATAELVDVTWLDGRRERCVEKVFDPGLLTRVIYRIAFAAPFAYQANRHAILACFYRRRVAAKLFGEQGLGIGVAKPLYVRFDEPRRSWVLAAEWIRGRGPIPKFAAADGSARSSRDEMADLVNRMQSAENSLIKWGLSGSGWQVSPRAMVSTANLLLVSPSPLSVVGPDESLQVAPTVNGHVIIDLESGIPAVLVARYLKIAWKQGSLFPFDDLDERRLRSQILREAGDASLAEDVEQLIFHNKRWKDAELAPLRKPWTLFSSQRISGYRKNCVDRWARCGLSDSNSEPLLRSRLSHFALFWLVDCLPLRSVAIRLQSFVGNQNYREKILRLLWDSKVRRDRISRWQQERLAQWRCENRVSAETTIGTLAFAFHTVAAATLSSGWHRFLVDPNRRRRRLRQTIGLFIHPQYQSIAARRQFSKVLRRWQSRHWIDHVQADQLRAHLNGPRIVVYSRGMAMHLGIKALYPFFAPLKLGGAAMLLSGGSVWLAIAPFAVLPVLRTMVTLVSRWKCRNENVPHAIALAVGVIPTLGSSAFLIQTWTADREVFAVWAREIAAALGRRLPVYGGADSRTEHACLAIVDRILVKPTSAVVDRQAEFEPAADRWAA